jgi:hypothetical protein
LPSSSSSLCGGVTVLSLFFCLWSLFTGFFHLRISFKKLKWEHASLWLRLVQRCMHYTGKAPQEERDRCLDDCGSLCVGPQIVQERGRNQRTGWLSCNRKSYKENRQDAFGPSVLFFQRRCSLLVILGKCLLINLYSSLNKFLFIIHYSDPSGYKQVMFWGVISQLFESLST